jgi:solute carrier family 13 (sodium-dependent dicarboxylate transporter), member 2/3/5
MSEPDLETGPRDSAVRRVGFFAGPAIFAILLALPAFWGLAPEAQRAFAVLAWVAVWWLTEPIHASVTALLPFVLLPALGVMTSKNAARGYQDDAIFLFLGGFLLAAALETTGVHRRMAQAVLRVFGSRPRPLVFGFCVTTTFLSMWLSNAATTLLILPAALALADEARRRAPHDAGAKRFGSALVLSVALCSTIGGLATPVGTVPNMILVSRAREAGLDELVTFVAWATVALPIAIGLLAAHFALLTFVTCRYPARLDLPPADVGDRRAPWTAAQRWAAGVFCAVVVLWLTRQELELGSFRMAGWMQWARDVGLISKTERNPMGDGVAAMAGALLLFLIRPGRGERPILSWASAEKKMPWGVLFLLGSSFVLADAFESPRDATNGRSLSAVFASALSGMSELSPTLRLWALAFGTAMISEIGSNTAVAALAVPIGLAAAGAAGHDPIGYGYAITFGASCSFALPVSTPPNTLAYGTGRVPLALMIGHGFLLDLVAAPLIAWSVS